MSDIVDALRNGLCPPNTGCMSIKTCICDLLGDAADEIERLRGTVMGQEVKIHKLSDEVARLRGIIHAMSNSPNAILEGQ